MIGGGNETAGTSPAEVGKRVAHNVVTRLEPRMPAAYHSVCACYGALLFSEATGETELRERIEAAYVPYLSGELKPDVGHVDYNVFGIVPFELFRQTGRRDYVPLARHLADQQYENPRDDGLTPQTRFWLDDAYMVGSLQAQAYKALHDPEYANRAAAFILAYVERLQQPGGLFRHTLLESPHRWGRGNGWAAAGMTEALLAVPHEHPKRPDLLAAYRKLMDALVGCQDAGGLWRQLLDEPAAWLESSGTGMFVFALATGLHQGWLPAGPHADAARRGWRALAGCVDAEGRVSRISAGIVAESAATYLNTPPYAPGDFHGQAALLWAATAMVRLDRQPPLAAGDAP